jgi:hypothetical protein
MTQPAWGKERAALLGGLSNQRGHVYCDKRKAVNAWRTGRKGSAR